MYPAPLPPHRPFVPPPAPKLSKPQVQERIAKFKRWILVGVLASFAAISGLAAEHSFAASANTNAGSNQQNSGGFFDQGGGNNLGGNSGNGPVTTTSAS